MGRARGGASTHAISMREVLSGRRRGRSAPTPSVRYVVHTYKISDEGEYSPVTLPARYANYRALRDTLEVHLVHEKRNQSGEWERVETIQTIRKTAPHSIMDSIAWSHKELKIAAQELTEQPPGWRAEQTVSEDGRLHQSLIKRKLECRKQDGVVRAEISERVIDRATFDPDDEECTVNATMKLLDFKARATEENDLFDSVAEDRELSDEELTEKRERARALAGTVHAATRDDETPVGKPDLYTRIRDAGMGPEGARPPSR